MYRILIILLFIVNRTNVQAQNVVEPYAFSCHSGFYQLVDNQLHILSVNAKGEILWVPILPRFERSLSALAYCTDDGLLYSFDTTTHELLRIYQSGAIQPLWVPIDERNGNPLSVQLTKGALIEGIFCAYAPQEDSLYWVDIQTGRFTKSRNPMRGALTNLSYHPIKKVLYSIGAKSRIQYLDLYTKEMVIGKQVYDLPTGHTREQANTWMTKDGRMFMTRKGGSYFVEINEKENVFYHYNNPLDKTIGDGTSCPDASPPVFIQSDVLELQLDIPKLDRVMLRWIGVHEYSNEDYVIEHSTDHQQWSKASEKPSIGINNFQNPYGARLVFDQEKDNYYRLKKEYQDGNRLAYSPTVFIAKQPTGHRVVLSPQLVLDQINLALYIRADRGEVLEVVIKNSLNQVVVRRTYQMYTTEATFDLTVEELPTGLYWVQISSKNHQQQEWIWVD